MNTKISVNGEDGGILAKVTGIHAQQLSHALVLHNESQVTREGQAGLHAPQAIRGGPGGTLVCQLFESNISQGAIRVERVKYSSTQHPPQITEVPIGRDVVLTAIGGNGEPGGNGSDGQPGSDGVNGVGASTASDATHGTNGGRGGDGGQGSNGADGGPGGALHIIVREENIHLLMPLEFDVKGGLGGPPGKHGLAGPGGKGGIGGQGWRWEDIVGYKPYCTPSCIKEEGYAPNSTSDLSNALAHVSSKVNASSSAMRAQMGALTVKGNNLPQMMQQVALRHSAMKQNQPKQGGDACRCGGGTGSCAGCDVKPIIKKFVRASGLNGKDGENGISTISKLAHGHNGEPGTVTIIVQGQDGSVQEYDSVWSLELTDFDVEDENGDGVFEPGEHAFIRRVKIRNVGGMPLPTCPIPVTLAQESSEWFERLPETEGGVSFLPTSVPPGGSASSSGSIKVRIKQRLLRGGKQMDSGNRFSAKDTLRIRAYMPWLNRQMPGFGLSSEIDIGYPCTFGDFNILRTVAQGAISLVNFEVRNTGNIPLGNNGGLAHSRVIEIRSVIPKELGRLIGDKDHEEVIRKVSNIRPRASTSLQQLFFINTTARCHRHFPITFEMYIESPCQDATSSVLETTLVEIQIVQVQVSNAYNPTPSAKMLLLTNPRITESQSRAIQIFTTTHLNMGIDICNVHENGGLLTIAKTEHEKVQPITTAYEGKTVVVLDNKFPFFQSGDRTTSHFWDPQWLSEAAANGNSVLFIGSGDDAAYERMVKLSVFPLSVKLEHAIKEVPRARVFSTSHDLVDYIKQEKQFGNAGVTFSTVTLKSSKWYRMGFDSAKKQGKALAAVIREQLPNERCLVSFSLPTNTPYEEDSPRSRAAPNKPDSNANDGYLIIFTGMDHHRTITSTDLSMSARTLDNLNSSASQPNAFFKYTITAALPFSARVERLWAANEPDDFITRAVILSLKRDIYNQFKTFLSSAQKGLATVVDEKEIDPFLRTHLPYIDKLLGERRASQIQGIPEAVKTVVHWALACAISVRSHKQLGNLIGRKIRLCESTKNLDISTASQDMRIDFDSDCPESLLEELSLLTNTPTNFFLAGELSARTLVPRTRFCLPAEWNAIVDDLTEWRNMLGEDMRVAQEQRDHMLVNYEAVSVAELSGLET